MSIKAQLQRQHGKPTHDQSIFMLVTTVTPKAGFIKLRHVMYSILSHVEDRAMGSSFCRDDLFNHGNDEFHPVLDRYGHLLV